MFVGKIEKKETGATATVEWGWATLSIKKNFDDHKTEYKPVSISSIINDMYLFFEGYLRNRGEWNTDDNTEIMICSSNQI